VIVEAAVEIKNILTEKVGWWERVTDAGVWVAQVDCKRFLVSEYWTWGKQ
jgi:hypothetical protein